MVEGGFNLDAIIAVGEALGSRTARRFRRWTNHHVYVSGQGFDPAHLVGAIRDRVEEQPRDLVATNLVKHDFRKGE